MRGPFDSQGESSERVAAFWKTLSAWYHLPVLAGAMAFMFATRMLSYENFVRDDGGFYLAAIDSYYHWRSTRYTLENWPNTMPYEVWTAFPTGQGVGQFGTAFDQLIATIALVVGLGDPSEALLHQVVLVSVPLMAALVAIPVFLIGRRLGGRIGGLGGVVLLALFPGSFFLRTTTGQFQHHVAEVLFMAIAVLAFMVALRVAEREKPVFEQVGERDLHGLRPTLGFGALAGVALALYIWIWPPGIVLVGILGVFFVVYLALEYLAGRSPEHLAFVGVVAMSVAGVLVLGQIEEVSAGVTSFGYLAPLLAAGVAAGCAVMAWLARVWDHRDLDGQLYPVAIAGSVVIALGLMWLLLPSVFNTVVGNLQGRITPFGANPGTLTIQEARPPADFGQHVFREFGLGFYTALIGLVGLVIAPMLGRQARAEHGLIVVWSLFIISMTTAQVRFTYYLAIVVAILNAYAIGLVIEWADLADLEEGIDGIRSIQGYQVMVLATVALILVVPILPPVASATVIDLGDRQGPHPDTIKWEESTEYLEGSTPEVGQWGGANDPLPYYGAIERPEDGDFPYPEGAYGVLSWWDYGHLITVEGKRIPHSNPFQTNARSSSAFLLSESEERATLILDALPTGEPVHELETEELREIVADRSAQQRSEQTRYVMIDDSMASGKFGAISEWSGPGSEAYVEREMIEIQQGEMAELVVMNDRYDNTTLSRLYFNDAEGMEHFRLVHESEQQSLMVSVAQRTQNGEWRTVVLNQRLAALGPEVYFQIQSSPDLAFYDMREASAVKTFERVEGATIQGETNMSTGVVIAFLQLNTTNTERPVRYTQSTRLNEDGTFELTVPYPTNDELGPADGYTNSTVLAEGEYIVRVVGEDGEMLQGTVTVPEAAIYEGAEVEVTLEPFELGDIEENEDGEDSDAEVPDDGSDDGEENASNESTE